MTGLSRAFAAGGVLRRLREAQGRAAARRRGLLAVRRTAASRGGRRARHHGIEPVTRPARGIGCRRQLHCGGHGRDRSVAAPPAGLFDLRSDRLVGDLTAVASSAGGTSISARRGAGSSASCGCCAAVTAGCTWSPSRGPGQVRTTRAISRTRSPGWLSRWPARRSPGCCGSAGAASGRSSPGSSPTGSMSGACKGRCASA